MARLRLRGAGPADAERPALGKTIALTLSAVDSVFARLANANISAAIVGRFSV
jgi:hypothetical protein